MLQLGADRCAAHFLMVGSAALVPQCRGTVQPYIVLMVFLAGGATAVQFRSLTTDEDAWFEDFVRRFSARAASSRMRL